jgi:hypothetical protein
MKPKRVAVLANLVVVLFVLCLSDALGWDSEYRQGFALSKSVERSSLIVVGRVIGKEFVFRENIEVLATTDVIIAADEVIKGTPNAGKDRVKFMLEGGRVVNPNTGEGINLYVTHQPEFTVGERILLFMVNSTDPYFKDYPYDRFHPYRGEYGKRVIKDDKVFIWFALDDDSLEGLKGIRMPLDLAVKLCKAADKDKDAMIQLENDIKDAIEQRSGSDINLSQPLIDRLMEEAEKIVDRNTESENQD